MSKSKQRRKQVAASQPQPHVPAAPIAAGIEKKVVAIHTEEPVAYMAMMDFSMALNGIYLSTRAGTKITDFHLIRAMLAGNAPIKAIEGEGFHVCPHCRHVFESGDAVA